MDLALQFGDPNLAHSLSERDFVQWQHYANKRMLPWRRMEFYLAQIAQLIAQTMGGATDVTMSDYLIVIRDPAADAELEAVKQAFQFNPRKRKSNA